MTEERIPFCHNSRRWLIGGHDPRTCPYRGLGATYCIGVGCGYYEERKPTAYLKRRLRLLEDGDD
jgi:hypothetical protein